MRWSQLKKQLHDRIAKSVVASIDLNQTRYRYSHDEEGEFWISFHGSRIFSTGSLSYLSSLAALTAKNRADGSTPAQAYELAWPVMDASGLFLLEQMNKDLFCSLSLTVEEMLDHNNPVVRGLAIIDARYGKRRLAMLNPITEHPLVQRLHNLRCEAEGVEAHTLS
ncbi:hypothetical protein O3301_01085 [Janthinobacterium sp. SUN211]|uniref:Uncharacterized protein n=1 Tax=Janthinobacterium kumbetense TaxID=2950280 RepID=A0ABT0WN92_9BURK|nr:MULTISPECIES: hypothetical protein [Janthinobacterium]MCM2565199.1 hypothetical protein [Janthinobacterium kumbetense]MDO8047038.1 hypothetical protein [Janthinobacterium sp. SUN211]